MFRTVGHRRNNLHCDVPGGARKAPGNMMRLHARIDGILRRPEERQDFVLPGIALGRNTRRKAVISAVGAGFQDEYQIATSQIPCFVVH